MKMQIVYKKIGEDKEYTKEVEVEITNGELVLNIENNLGKDIEIIRINY